MAGTIIAQQNQTALDVALMAAGTLEGAMQLMAAANISISAGSDTIKGTAFLIPDDMTTDADALQYLMRNGIVIGTNG